MTGHRHEPRLVGMLVRLVAALAPHEEPSIVSQQLEHIPHFPTGRAGDDSLPASSADSPEYPEKRRAAGTTSHRDAGPTVFLVRAARVMPISLRAITA